MWSFKDIYKLSYFVGKTLMDHHEKLLNFSLYLCEVKHLTTGQWTLHAKKKINFNFYRPGTLIYDHVQNILLILYINNPISKSTTILVKKQSHENFLNKQKITRWLYRLFCVQGRKEKEEKKNFNYILWKIIIQINITEEQRRRWNI